MFPLKRLLVWQSINNASAHIKSSNQTPIIIIFKQDMLSSCLCFPNYILKGKVKMIFHCMLSYQNNVSFTFPCLF